MILLNNRILCVDDDFDSCELIDHVLNYKQKDYLLTTISLPAEAIEIISKHSYDLYIFDYQLPGMSGVELCRFVRQTGDRTPILFFTAKAFPEDRENAINAGASEYLIKPDDLHRFKDTVKRLLSRVPALEPIA